MQRQGWVRVSTVFTAPSVGQGAQVRQFWLGPDFSGSALVDLWKQRLRDTRADSWYSHGWAGKGSANNSVHCKPAQQATGNIAEHPHQWTAVAEEYSAAPPSVGVPNLPPSTPAQKHSSHMYLEASTPTATEQTMPLTAQWQPQTKEEGPLNIQCHLCSPKHQTHLYGGDNSQQMLRKEAAGIHIKNGPLWVSGSIWQSQRTCAHFLLWEQKNCI